MKVYGLSEGQGLDGWIDMAYVAGEGHIIQAVQDLTDLDLPYANVHIAPPFKFVRVYFTKESIVTKRTCICLSEVSTLFDWSRHILT